MGLEKINGKMYLVHDNGKKYEVRKNNFSRFVLTEKDRKWAINGIKQCDTLTIEEMDASLYSCLSESITHKEIRELIKQVRNETGMKTDKAYLEANEDAVRKALKIAVQTHGNYVTLKQIRIVGRQNIKAPRISDWVVWDFAERTRNYLNRLERKGEIKITITKTGRIYRYNIKK